jgi:Patatin-like phospholipase
MINTSRYSRWAALVSIVFLPGCATFNSTTTLPVELEKHVQIPGFPNIRGWADEPSPALEKSAIESIKQEMAHHHGQLDTEINALALSGGGSDGAFGAGVLCGWSKSGKRPQFKLVTGISTGALMAPYAFLGSDYDGRLKEIYTSISDKDIYEPHSYFSILLSVISITPLPSLATDQPLAKLIERLIDEDVLKKVAAEHRKGRRLIMGSTQLNAERLVIWDMGAIATRGTPEALNLFRKVMLASASLPATFPPQIFDVEANGKAYTEMHVDGGVEAQVILVQNALIPFARGGKILKKHPRKRNLYIIRNLKTEPEWQDVKPQLRYIAIRSIGTLTKTQGIGDLFRLYTYAERDGMNYNLAYIPEDFTQKAKTPFDNDYMKKLFERGYTMGQSNSIWHHYPPLYRPRAAL